MTQGYSMLTEYSACGAAVAKIYFLVNFIADKDSTFHDRFFVLAAVELYLGILSASLPLLKRLATRLIDNVRAFLNNWRFSRLHSDPELQIQQDTYDRPSGQPQHMELKHIASTVITYTGSVEIPDESPYHNSKIDTQKPPNAWLGPR
ncbi:hypothetical protein LTR56_027406 [Elasticomyces elasticus]|nr:hypothetical protein LTR56_027406 [Elasticomyces elasticus]KAK4899303.1 hypothetical protein LTR49_027684 [Elasticomyces elasticus]